LKKLISQIDYWRKRGTPAHATPAFMKNMHRNLFGEAQDTAQFGSFLAGA
jgi:hypothetical protein